MEYDHRKNLKFNVTVSLVDAAFFGIGLGFGSFGTIIPLFFTKMTTSALLIGLIPAIHNVGWQIPQLFAAGWVSKMERFKPAVLAMTIHERLPFLGLAISAWLLYQYGPAIALPVAFIMLVWQGIGAGMTANPWQSMVAKIIPHDYHGTFFGTQAAIANIVMSVSAVAAGYLLDAWTEPYNFISTFSFTFLGMLVSFLFLLQTREARIPLAADHHNDLHFWEVAKNILRRDHNFRWFLAFRILFQFATMGFSFFILYSLKRFNMDNVTAGYLTASLTITQTIANISMGWMGDRFGHHSMLVLGTISSVLSALVAWLAPTIGWMYLVFIFSALANVAFWTIGIAMTVRFGSIKERPVYIGLANTLIAPASIGAPIIGGWIADSIGFDVTFIISLIFGLITTGLLLLMVRNPSIQVEEPSI